MIRNKLCFEKQFDEKLYQAMVPHEGTWEEAIQFSQEFLNYCKLNYEAALKKLDEEKVVEIPTEAM